MDNEKKELIEKFIDCLVVCSVELEQSIYFWLFKFRSILRACRINRLTRLNLFNIQLLVNDLTASHNSFVQLHQLKFHVSKLSPLFYDSIRSLVVWPYLTNRLRTRWQQAHLMYPFVISRTVLEQLGHASCVAQRLSTHRWSAIQLFIARFRVRLAQQIKNRMVRMQQPHAQQLPLFVIGSFVICNCFANGQTVVAIIFFALLQISMIFLKQKPLDRLFDAMIHRQQTDNVLWNDLHQSLMSTEFPFSVIQNDIKFLNYCLINLWPTLLMPVI